MAHPASSTAPAAPLDVLIVGAGLSGIGAARHLQQRCPGKTFALLEGRAALGGTWDLFRYPGIRSDSDMHTLGYSFKPWTAAKAIADGPSILNYIRSAAEETGVTQHIRYRHMVKRAAWSSADALWTVECEQQLDDGVKTAVQIQARFLYLCSGYYSYAEGHAPEFAGQADFQGQVVHPQFWPEKLDYANKQVVVIGSGATAVTLVPSMADTAAHVTMLQRSPTYVISRPAEDGLAQRLQRLLPDRLAYALTRWKNVGLGMFFFQLARRRPNKVKQVLVHLAKKQAGGQVDAAHFTPKYKPWDQRVCVVPDGDLFRQLRAGKASVVTDTVDHFTPTGIKLHSGKELKADIVVTATGLKLNALGDIAVTVDGRACNANQTLVYRGMMLSDVPNLAMAFGYTNASWTLKADLTAERVCRLLNHMDAQGLRTAVARPGNDVEPQPFLDFSSGYVQRAASLLPKQGSRRPWQVYQNYLLDMLSIRYSRIADGVVQFSR